MGSIGPTRGRCLSKLREALERMQQVVNASRAHRLERLDALIVDQLPAIPAVVLLSACEVGRSAVRWGQETLPTAGTASGRRPALQCHGAGW